MIKLYKYFIHCRCMSYKSQIYWKNIVLKIVPRPFFRLTRIWHFHLVIFLDILLNTTELCGSIGTVMRQGLDYPIHSSYCLLLYLHQNEGKFFCSGFHLYCILFILKERMPRRRDYKKNASWRVEIPTELIQSVKVIKISSQVNTPPADDLRKIWISCLVYQRQNIPYALTERFDVA